MTTGIAGVDEAGRGPLAGAVVAAVVILAPRQVIPGVKDSKLLSASQRDSLAVRIREEALAFALGRAEVDEIDSLNIYHATFLAMQRAVAALRRMPGEILVDGNRAPPFPGFGGLVVPIVGGDLTCPAISAASILAKVARDAEMCALDATFPQYGFARHKGYATSDHREALERHGPCAVHRRSFTVVRELLARSGTA